MAAWREAAWDVQMVERFGVAGPIGERLL